MCLYTQHQNLLLLAGLVAFLICRHSYRNIQKIRYETVNTQLLNTLATSFYVLFKSFSFI